MITKLGILRDYCSLSIQMSHLVKRLDEPGLPVEVYENKIDEINRTLARLEDKNPWIANVLVDMEGT